MRVRETVFGLQGKADFFGASLRKAKHPKGIIRKFAPDISRQHNFNNPYSKAQGGATIMEQFLIPDKAPKPTIILETGAMALFQNTYTMQEHKYVMKTIAAMQPVVRHAINQKARHRRVDLSKVNHLDSDMYLEIPFAQLEQQPSHYPNLEQALARISEKPVRIPFLSDYPQPPSAQQAVRSQVGLKEFPRLLQYKRSFLRSRKRYALVTIPFEVLQYLLAVDFGYHRINLDLMFSFRHYATRRLYQLTESRIKLGMGEFYPSLLFKMLTENSTYAGLGHLESHQLADALREIRNAYDHKRYDLKLSYTKRQILNKFTPSQTVLHFDVTYRQDDMAGKDAASQQQFSLDVSIVKSRLVSYWRIDEKVATDLCQRIVADMLPRIRVLLDEAKAKYAAKKLYQPAGFIVSEMKKIVG